MTLPTKGSRNITVDGTRYRWRLRGRPTYDRGLCWSPLTYAVDLAERPGGTTLVVTTNRSHPGNWIGRPPSAVLPSEVADSVRTALVEGWEPGFPGKPFRVDRSAGFEAWR